MTNPLTAPEVTPAGLAFLAELERRLPYCRRAMAPADWRDFATDLRAALDELNAASPYDRASVGDLIRISARYSAPRRALRRAAELYAQAAQDGPAALTEPERARAADLLARIAAALVDSGELETMTFPLPQEPEPFPLDADRAFLRAFANSLPRLKRALGAPAWHDLAAEIAAWQRGGEFVEDLDLIREVDILVLILQDFPAAAEVLRDAIAAREAGRWQYGYLPEAALVKAAGPEPDAEVRAVAEQVTGLDRYLNTDILDGTETPLPADRPLSAGRAYTLKVAIESSAAPGTPAQRLFSADWLPPPRFAVLIVVGAQDPEVLSVEPSCRLLHVSQYPDDAGAPAYEPARFAVKAIAPGTGRLSVDVLYNGALVQSQEIHLAVVAGAGESADPRSMRVTAATYALAFERVPVRGCAVAASRQDDTYQFRWYGGARAADPIDVRIHHSAVDLGDALQRTRAAVEQAMNARYRNDGKEWTVDAVPRLIARMAYAGHMLYTQLLVPRARGLTGSPQAGALEALLARDLRAGDLLQVSTLAPNATLPWELVYPWPVPTPGAGESRLCPDYLKHLGAARCPRVAEDPRYVCPAGFWGFRYVIEQLPAWATPNGSNIGAVVANGPVTRLAFNVNETFPWWKQHHRAIEKLAAAPDWSVVAAGTRAAVQQALAGPAPHIIYFYVHGGGDSVLGSYLLLKENEALTCGDFEPWGINWWPVAPLVFLNGCSTAAYSPADFTSLIDEFQAAGAAATIGTQCLVYEALAQPIAEAFFRAFLTGATAGDALRQARLELLRTGNPLGLAYSLYAAADTRLWQAVKPHSPGPPLPRRAGWG